MQHAFGDARLSGVSNEVGAELARGRVPKRLVVPDDLPGGAVWIGDRRDRDMRVRGLGGLGQLDDPNRALGAVDKAHGGERSS
jgi:hypothetical protein